MKFLDELKPLRLYSSNRKFYIPINEKNKKKGSAIFLLTDSFESSNRLMNLPYMYNPNYFVSYYINRDATTYVKSDGTIEAEGDDIISEATTLPYMESNVYGGNKTKIVFGQCASVDKSIIGGVVTDDLIKRYCRMLGCSQPPEIKINVVRSTNDFKQYSTDEKHALSANDRDSKIYVLDRPTFESEVTDYMADKTEDKDELYRRYIAHEIAEICIYYLNSKCNFALATAAASYMAEEYKMLDKKKVNSVKTAEMVEGIVDQASFRVIRKMIFTNDLSMFSRYVQRTTWNSVKELFKENAILEMKFNNSSNDVGKKHIAFRSLKKIPMTDENIKKYKNSCRDLSHIRTGDKCHGFIFIDPDSNTPAAYYNTEVKEDGTWIQALEVLPEYQKSGIGSVLLSDCLDEENANRLSVNKSNTIAHKMYLKNDWVDYDETPSMYFMKFGESADIDYDQNMASFEETGIVNESNSDDSLTGLFNEEQKTLNILPSFMNKGHIQIDPKENLKNIHKLSDDDDTANRVPSQLAKIDSIPVHSPKQLQEWMKANIHETSANKLKSYNETINSKSGSSFDQALVLIHELRRMHFKVRGLFLTEYDPHNPKNIGESRAIVYYYGRDDQIYWIENCMRSFCKINGPYEDEEDLKRDLYTYHGSHTWGNAYKYPNPSISTLHLPEVGSDLRDIIDSNMSIHEEAYVRASYKLPPMSAEEADFYKENGYLINENYARFSTPYGIDCMTLFSEAVEDKQDDAKLRRMLYKDRLKTNRSLLDLYNKAQLLNPWIRTTFLTLKKYSEKNVFIDLYYYHSLFLKNNTFRMDKGVNIYWDMLNRLIDDPGINELYSKKTIFVPIDKDDWGITKDDDLIDWKRNLNPISLIYRMLRMQLQEIQSRWGKYTFLFAGRRGYFIIDFSTVEYKDWVRIKNNLRKIMSEDEPIVDDEDPDDFEDEKDSSKVMTAQIVDKIEKNTGIEINNISGETGSPNATLLGDIDNCVLSTKPFSIPISHDGSGTRIYLLAHDRGSSMAMMSTKYLSNKEDIPGYNRPKK